MKRPIVALSVATALVLGAGAATLHLTAQAGPELQPDSISNSEAVRLIDQRANTAEEQQATERAAAIDELSDLPDGDTYDAGMPLTEFEDAKESVAARRSPMTTDPGPIAVYEDGYFSSTAAIDWQCAWVAEAAQAYEAGDPKRTESAIDELASFNDTSLVEAFPDYNSIFMPEIVLPIRDGEVDAALEWHHNSC